MSRGAGERPFFSLTCLVSKKCPQQADLDVLQVAQEHNVIL